MKVACHLAGHFLSYGGPKQTYLFTGSLFTFFVLTTLHHFSALLGRHGVQASLPLLPVGLSKRFAFSGSHLRQLSFHCRFSGFPLFRCQLGFCFVDFRLPLSVGANG